MLSTNNNRSSSTGTPRNENATQKLIRENVDFLIEQLEAGQSDALTAYLTAMTASSWERFAAGKRAPCSIR